VIRIHSLDLSNPLSFVVVLALALIDGVFPLVPTRTAVIALGVIAGTGDHRAYPLLALATVGAFISDNISYWLGARHGSGIARRLLRGQRARRVWTWVAGEINRHGGLLVAFARVIPGGPTPITLAAGLVHLPIRRFRLAALGGSCLWSAYAFGVGMFGDLLTGQRPLWALAVGFVLAATVNLLLVVGMRRRRATARGRERSLPADEASGCLGRPVSPEDVATPAATRTGGRRLQRADRK
jgi:membrane protein DedA with SNARE-associated domain